MRLRPIKNHIIFQFVDEVDANGKFVEKTDWGFVIPGHFDNSAKSPRWCNVVEVGPECEDIKAGQQILVQALKWTPGFKLDDVRYWRTDETQVSVTRTSPTSPLVPLRDNVIFKRHDDNINEGKHGIQVVGDSIVETPKGTVVSIGPKCEDELKEATVFYSEENFFNKFEHEDKELWFIDEPSILAYEPA